MIGKWIIAGGAAIAISAAVGFFWMSPDPTPETLPHEDEVPRLAQPARVDVEAARSPDADPIATSVVQQVEPKAAEAIRAGLQRWQCTSENETGTRDRLLEEMLARLTDQNTPDIVRGLSADEFHTRFGARALARWLAIHPMEAARWIEARPDATEEHAWLVAREFGREPEQLLNYCDALLPGTWRENVLNSASAEMVTASPAAAIAIAGRMMPGAVRLNAIETAAYAWYAQNPAAATAWTGTVTDEALRQRLLAIGAKAIATADPDLAASWLVTSVKAEPVLRETALSIVEAWAEQQPEKAAAWVAHFSDDPSRKTAVDLLLNQWMKSDPSAAEAWIRTLPDRESLLAALAEEKAAREKPASMD